MSLKEYTPTCQDCKHACYYPNYWTFPWTDPKCEITKNSISPKNPACENFELIGRLSR